MTKLALVVLLCCVSVAFQQQYQQQPQRFYARPPLRYYSPAARPLFFPNYGYSDQYLQLLTNYYSDPTENDDYAFSPTASESGGSDTEGRVSAGFHHGSPQAKFFGFGMANLLSSLLTANNALITVTSTVLATITSTASIVSVKSCIGAAQFVAGSSNTCSRKRRGINVEEIKALAAIDPTPIQSMVATNAPDALSFRSGRSQDYETEIVSSLNEQLSVDNGSAMVRQKRRAVIVTVTSTITSFVLTTTSIIQSFTLLPAGFADPNLLVCLPSGYTVC